MFIKTMILILGFLISSVGFSDEKECFNLLYDQTVLCIDNVNTKSSMAHVYVKNNNNGIVLADFRTIVTKETKNCTECLGKIILNGKGNEAPSFLRQFKTGNMDLSVIHIVKYKNRSDDFQYGKLVTNDTEFPVLFMDFSKGEITTYAH